MRWTELPLDTLAAAGTQWRLTTLAETVSHAIFTSLLARVIRAGVVWCETKDTFGDPVRLLVLRVHGAELGIGDETFEPEQVRHDNTWILALTPDDPVGDWPRLPLGPLALSVNDRQWTLRVGEAPLTITLPWSRKQRDWAWAWPPTVGPATLNVIVDASEPQIDAWFAEHASKYYALTSTDVWGRRFEGRISNQSVLRLYPHAITFLRGYTAPPIRQLAADHVLLAGLIAGALPVTGFDVIDGDYMVTTATGFSAESLRDYLHANRRLHYKSPHRWKKGLEWHTVDATEATSEAAVEEALTRSLRAYLRTEAPLDELIRSTSLESLPRVITVEHAGDVAVEALAARLRPLRPRVQWRWTANFAKGKRTIISG